MQAIGPPALPLICRSPVPVKAIIMSLALLAPSARVHSSYPIILPLPPSHSHRHFTSAAQLVGWEQPSIRTTRLGLSVPFAPLSRLRNPNLISASDCHCYDCLQLCLCGCQGTDCSRWSGGGRRSKAKRGDNTIFLLQSPRTLCKKLLFTCFCLNFCAQNLRKGEGKCNRKTHTILCGS